MLPALNEITATQAHPTQKALEKVQQLMDSANTFQDAYVRYHASDIVLHVDCDAAYLVTPKAKSRVAGYY